MQAAKYLEARGWKRASYNGVEKWYHRATKTKVSCAYRAVDLQQRRDRKAAKERIASGKLYRIETPKCVAGVIVCEGKVALAAPYFRWLIGLSEPELLASCEDRGWKIEASLGQPHKDMVRYKSEVPVKRLPTASATPAASTATSSRKGTTIPRP